MTATVPTSAEFSALQASVAALKPAPISPAAAVVLKTSDSIQNALNDGNHVQLQAASYNLPATLTMPRGLTVRGMGQSTRLVATADMDAVVLEANVDGVSVSDLVLDADGKANVGLHAVNTTASGAYQDEPDNVNRWDNIWIYDPLQAGVRTEGTISAGIASRIRVRRAGQYAFDVQAPDSKWVLCEGTTNASAGDNAGWFVWGNASNNTFTSCSAWYVRGFGWHIKATRNTLNACDSSDTMSHGFNIEWGADNLLSGCRAETAGMYDVGGTPNTADGFYVADPAVVLSGCIAYDRQPGGHAAQMRYAFNIPKAMQASGHMQACVGRNPSTVNYR